MRCHSAVSHSFSIRLPAPDVQNSSTVLSVSRCGSQSCLPATSCYTRTAPCCTRQSDFGAAPDLVWMITCKAERYIKWRVSMLLYCMSAVMGSLSSNQNAWSELTLVYGTLSLRCVQLPASYSCVSSSSCQLPIFPFLSPPHPSVPTSIWPFISPLHNLRGLLPWSHPPYPLLSSLHPSSISSPFISGDPWFNLSQQA